MTRNRGTASTGVVRLGKNLALRVVWTNSGVAFVDDESDASLPAIERRLKWHLEKQAVPKIVRDALAAAQKGGRQTGIPVDLSWATDYERDVLFAAMSIRRGTTKPYSWLAREARRPLAVRAAASAIARNPLWLLVPCHRVISKDGTIGSYGPSGTERKRKLLEREGVKIPVRPRAKKR